MKVRRLPVVLAPFAAVALGGAAWLNPAPTPTPLPQPAQQQAPVEVASWSLSRGHLTMTLHGNQAALDRLRDGRALSIVVHWAHAGSGGAPDLVTELPVARPGLVPALAGEVRRQGYFAWHAWVEKRSLSPGAWTVSLTLPDGSPVPCAPQQAPCRLTFNTG